ncbi:MAG: polyprenyl synthetase family protein [Spirochaetia bacterium]|nr:polyprenyl synthetase family protein [Spirochaetia bacterium]
MKKIHINEIIKSVNKRLEEIILDDLPVLNDIKKFVIESGGKRVRPIMLCLLNNIYNGNSKGALVLAAIVEIIHAASLLHDDVLDEADTRRGKPSGKALFGSKTVVLAGDYLLACGIKKLNEFNNSQLMSIFTKVIHDLSTAELYQMEYEKNSNITIEIYNKIIYGKTASLFQAACESAALWCNLKKEEINKLSILGKEIGMFFQIRDDYLDYFNPKILKKDPFQDFQRGIYTYPIIKVKNNQKNGINKKIHKYFLMSDKLRKNKEIQKDFMNLLHENNSKEKTLKDLEKLGESISLRLKNLPNGISKDLMEEQFKRLLNIN